MNITMRKKTLMFISMLLISNDLCTGINSNVTKYIKGNHKKSQPRAEQLTYKYDERIKRSLIENDEPLHRDDFGTIKYYDRNKPRQWKSDDILEEETPFWGNRGRRDSSEEYLLDSDNNNHQKGDCLYCKPMYNLNERNNILVHELEPFWGNRGRRGSEESDNEDRLVNKQNEIRNEDDPFWGARGRREEEDPFWGARGRREDKEPFWGNRGRRDSKPYWGSKGTRDDIKPFRGFYSLGDDFEPSRTNVESQKGNDDRTDKVKQEIKQRLGKLSRYRRSKSLEIDSFWSNRGRDSKLKYLFSGPQRFKNDFLNPKTHFDPGSIRYDQMFADQPHFILVERSSRSSGEDDPYIISRGKKMKLSNIPRGRRGSLEDIVKSMKTDPYFIARGKKDEGVIQNDYTKLKNKEIICKSFEYFKNNTIKAKRDISENDRARRNALKQLAAKLQMDPYFVSRGKKDQILSHDEIYNDIIQQLEAICHEHAE